MAQRKFAYWNRKFHIYLGVYFVLFIWLFSISGLILNHTAWNVFRKDPVIADREVQFTVPEGEDNQAKTEALIKQLGITGEIHQTGPMRDGNGLSFLVNRPHMRYIVNANFDTGVATIKERKMGFWAGIMNSHTFSSVSARGMGPGGVPRERDWIFTWLWSISVDALSVGLCIMVLSGIYMWWKLPKKRLWGSVSLILGFASCGFFMFGLRMFL